MMLPVIPLSMLMILIPTLHILSFGNNQSSLLNLNLAYETLEWGRKCFVDFRARKTQFVSFDLCNIYGTVDLKNMGLALVKNQVLRYWYCPSFLSTMFFNCGSPTSIFEPNKVQKFQFQTSRICSKIIIRTRNFIIFTVYITIFGQFLAAFRFSNYIGKIDHFTLDLLKSSDT